MTDGEKLGTAENAANDPAMERVSLQVDNGAQISFMGRQFAGGSIFNEETRALTRQNHYVTTANELVYTITERNGTRRSRRAYRISTRGDLCTIHDGRQEITLGLDMLMLAMKALTGVDKHSADILAAMEETLRAANC